MELEAAIRERRSIRRFKTDEVPEGIISEILEAARWAPSWGNTQPWECYVVTGKALEAFKRENRKYNEDGVSISPEIEMPKLWPESLKERYVGLGKGVLSSLEIARHDINARNRYYADMFELFGAPCLILTCVDKSICLEYAMLDVGLISQTICLLAHEKGLGTCMLAASVSYPELVRKYVPIPDTKIPVIGTAMGYPDWDSPVNTFKRERAKPDEFVRWVK